MPPIPPALPFTADNQLYARIAGQVAALAMTDRGYEYGIGPGGSLMALKKPQYNLAAGIDLLVGSDHSAELKAIFDEHGAGWEYVLPECAATPLKLPLQIRAGVAGTSNQVPNLPSHCHLTGEGRGSVILVTGYESGNFLASVPNSTTTKYAALEVSNIATPSEVIEDILIENLAIVGDWSAADGGPGATGSNPQGQTTALSIRGGGGANIDKLRRFTVRRVSFANHYGFPVSTANGEHFDFEKNDLEYCGNGANLNTDYLNHLFNTYRYMEGMESSGRLTLSLGNKFYEVFGALSLGGYNGVGYYGGVRSIADRVYGSQGETTAISFAESSPDDVILAVYVERAHIGISTGPVPVDTGPTDGPHVDLAHVVSCGATGVRLLSNNARLSNSRIYNRADILTHEMEVALYVAGDNCHASSSYLRGTTASVDIALNKTLHWGPGMDVVAGTSGVINFNSGSKIANAQYLGETILDVVASGSYNRFTTILCKMIRCSNPTGTATLGLPILANVPLKEIIVTREGAGAVVLDPFSTETVTGGGLSGAATATLGAGAIVKVEAIGSVWRLTVLEGTVS